LKRWYAPGEAEIVLAEIDVRPGGRYRVHMRGPDGTVYRLSGEYREVVRPEKLVFTWRWDHEPAEQETLVTVELKERGSGTVLVLTHEGFTSTETRGGHEIGWNAVFEKLSAALTAG
jgi:uncharacterized protein YndB with AHSA1/START domain